MSYSVLYKNQINARALIGQSAVVYCLIKINYVDQEKRGGRGGSRGGCRGYAPIFFVFAFKIYLSHQSVP